MLLAKALNYLVRIGDFSVIDAGGKTHNFGDGTGVKIVIKLHDKSLNWKLAINPDLHLGEAYMDGTLTVEAGSLYDFLDLLSRNFLATPPHPIEKFMDGLDGFTRIFQQYNPVGKAQENVAHHYDLSDELYTKFLDSDMQYSCAYFTHDGQSLEDAQLAKKRHIAAKLALKPDMKVLDIGCGWGGMAITLAKDYGVSVTGLTLSIEQQAKATERVKQAGLEDKIKIELRDYRHETGQYDRIVTVGMFEHVGVNHYGEFFNKIKDLLKPDGVALLHSIGRADGAGTTSQWLRKYIFPGGYAPALSEVFPTLEKSGLWATDIEILRLHYAKTLAEWHKRFQTHRAEIAKLYDEKFCRMWEFYLLGSEMEFRYGNLMNFQIQITKDVNTLPLTREYML